MSKSSFSIALYYDQDTDRQVWGVFCAVSHVWYFPEHDTEAAASDMADRLNH